MARPLKTGIDYFPLDVEFFNSDKIQLIESEFGLKGGYLALRLLCKIYKEGYYYRWGEDECLLLAKAIGADGITTSEIEQIIARLIRRNFFDKTCFDKFSILTSANIQARYFEATRRYKQVTIVKEYLLTDKYDRDNVKIESLRDKNKCQPKVSAPDPKVSNEDCFSFEGFWELYDKKIGNIQKLSAKWQKLPLEDKKAIYEYIPLYKKAVPEKQFRKNPETFLNNKSWNDEIIQIRKINEQPAKNTDTRIHPALQ